MKNRTMYNRLGYVVAITISLIGITMFKLSNTNSVETETINIDTNINKYYVAGSFYKDTLDTITKHTLNLYNPPNKQAYEEAFRGMTSLMTEACKQSYQRQLGSYVASSNKTVTIDKVDVGFKDWQEDGEDKILVRLCVQDGTNKNYITTEYKIGNDNRIYTYEMW